MHRELKERMKLISDNTRARVFSASYNPRYSYPYRLQNAPNACQPVRDACYELMVDSGFNDDSVTNDTVLEKAEKFNADYVFPKDYPGEQHRTHVSLSDFLSKYQQSNCNAKMIVVLQPPYDRQYLNHEQFYSQFSHFALGGLHSLDSPEAQVSAIKKFREVAGTHCYVHALGVGTSLEMIRAIRENPRLVDSIDCSTAETTIKNNVIPDKSWKQTPFFIPEGIDSTSVRARFSAAILYMLNYMLGTRVDDENLEQAYYEQTTLGEVDQAIRTTTPPTTAPQEQSASLNKW